MKTSTIIKIRTYISRSIDSDDPCDEVLDCAESADDPFDEVLDWAESAEDPCNKEVDCANDPCDKDLICVDMLSINANRIGQRSGKTKSFNERTYTSRGSGTEKLTRKDKNNYN